MAEQQSNPRAEMIDIIRQNLSPSALYEQLAEELVELAYCAQKQARLMRGENPTNSDMVELVKATDEELADVLVCLDVLSLMPNENLMMAKLDRWAGRILAYSRQREMSVAQAEPVETEQEINEEVE